MSELCPQCGAPIAPGARACEYCGTAVAQPAPQAQPQVQPQQVVYTQQNNGYSERANWPVKSKIAAAILAFFLGGFGIHKFYLGQNGKGILYLIFFWTYIPAIIAFFEAIILLCTNDENFQLKYKCRLG